LGAVPGRTFHASSSFEQSALPCEGFNLEMVDDIANARDISENVEENLMLGKFSHQRPPLAL